MTNKDKITDYTHVTIVASAAMDGDETLLARCKGTFVIAVDGGLNHCHRYGITPHQIIGDLDSVDKSILPLYSKVETIILPRDKDVTDLEEALNRIDFTKTQKAVILGALGERLDHTLGNLILLARYPGKVFIESKKEIAFALDPSNPVENYPSHAGQTISLIPLNGPALGINSKGLKWELKNDKMDKSFIGISNESLGDKFSVSLKQGDLLCIINT